MRNAEGDHPVFLNFHRRTRFWLQLFFVQLDVKKKDILFWGVCDVTVMQCNVWGQGADLVCVCVPGHRESTCSKVMLSRAERLKLRDTH